MALSSMLKIIFLSIFVNVIEGSQYETCNNLREGQIYYCKYGCCGERFDQSCCTITGTVAGSVIGGIIIIAIIITICYWTQHNGHGGRVIVPATQPGVTVIGMQQSAVYGQMPGPATMMYPRQPPAYSQQGMAIPSAQLYSEPGKPMP